MSVKIECLVSCLSYCAEDVREILLNQKLTVRLHADKEHKKTIIDMPTFKGLIGIMNVKNTTGSHNKSSSKISC